MCKRGVKKNIQVIATYPDYDALITHLSRTYHALITHYAHFHTFTVYIHSIYTLFEVVFGDKNAKKCFFIKKYARACIYEKKVVNLQPIWNGRNSSYKKINKDKPF